MNESMNLEFAKKILSYRRMCGQYGDCSDCPISENCFALDNLLGEETNRVIEWLISQVEKTNNK